MEANELPEGRLTNADVAKYVALQLADAREEIREEATAQQATLRGWIAEYVDARLTGLRDSLRDGERRFRVEMRAWLACTVVLNAVHPGTTTAIASVAASFVGIRVVNRFFNN